MAPTGWALLQTKRSQSVNLSGQVQTDFQGLLVIIMLLRKLEILSNLSDNFLT